MRRPSGYPERGKSPGEDFIVKKLPKRKRLMLFYMLGGALLVLLAGVAAFQTMNRGTDKYQPGVRVEGITNTLSRSADAPAIESGKVAAPGAATASPVLRNRLFFEDVAASSGIHFQHFPAERSSQLPEDMGSGAAWGDFDGNGDDDLYICNIAGSLAELPGVREARASGSNRLYRNDGNGRFVDVTQESGTGLRALSMGSAWADYDGDSDLDLLVTCYGRNVLYRNDGGKFTDVSDQSGIGGIDGFWTGASWGDYDRDGDLDLYVCGYVRYKFEPADAEKKSLQYKAAIPFTLNPSSYPAERNLLYRNNGDGTFTEVALEAGVDNPTGRSLSASWCDFDLDGWLDLYVANDISDNTMYRNLGNGRFADISHSAWVADYRGAMGLAIGDWDNDTDFDIYVAHWIAQESAFYNNLVYVFGDTSTRSPNLRFMDIADQVGLGQVSLDYICWGTSFLDFDNDGLLDLFVTNGSTFEEEANPKLLVPMRNLLFQNRGEEEGFYEVGSATGAVFSQNRVGRGAAFSDFDQDGDMDIFVLNHSSAPFLLQNQGGNSQNWIKIRLEGRKGNRQGLGARILIRTGKLRQSQQVGAQSSYLSQNSTDSLFGIGKADLIDEIDVFFLSGVSRKLSNLKANQLVIVREE
jgi:enediyne biosynthesis protein E4